MAHMLQVALESRSTSYIVNLSGNHGCRLSVLTCTQDFLKPCSIPGSVWKKNRSKILVYLIWERWILTTRPLGKVSCVWFEIFRNTIVVICPFAEDFFERYWFGFSLVRKVLLLKLVVMKLAVVGEEQGARRSCWHCARETTGVE